MSQENTAVPVESDAEVLRSPGVSNVATQFPSKTDSEDVSRAQNDGPTPSGTETLDTVGEIDITDLGAPSLEAAIEAVLLVADQPIDSLSLASLTRRPQHEVVAVLDSLASTYDSDWRGIELREVGGGWRLYTRENCADVVERYIRDGQQARLTQAALETLAVIAYRQPISRVRVSAVRGVNVDGVVRTLASRGLVEEAGHDQDSGAVLYRTSSYFLERLGLRELGDLPPLAEFLPDIESMTQFIDEASS